MCTDVGFEKYCFLKKLQVFKNPNIKIERIFVFIIFLGIKSNVVVHQVIGQEPLHVIEDLFCFEDSCKEIWSRSSRIRQQNVAGEENISVSNSPTSHFLLKRERFMSFKFAHLLFNRENRIDTRARN